MQTTTHEPGHVLGTFTKPTLCTLTKDEMLERARDLAQTDEDIQAEEQRAADVKAQLKAAMTELTARRTRLSSIVRRGQEMRDVEVTVEVTKPGRVREVSVETGEVLLSDRAMTEDEAQGRLFDEELA